MRCRYLTVEREYGSGGTKIARQLAEKVGIPCYGQEILEAVSKKYDISVDRIQKFEEPASNSFLYSVYMMAQAAAGNSDMLSVEGGVVKVFIRCGDEEEKRKRILQDYGISETQADAVRKRFDKKRSNYYSANTMRKWEDPKNYDVILDSATLGIDGCVDVLESILRRK